MNIDRFRVVRGSAYAFSAIGGGWGVKMRCLKGNDFVFGQFNSRLVAEGVVANANSYPEAGNWTSDEIIAGPFREDDDGPESIVSVNFSAAEMRCFREMVDEMSDGFGQGENTGYDYTRPLLSNVLEKLRWAIHGTGKRRPSVEDAKVILSVA